jgi:Uma2 family endonuclease
VRMQGALDLGPDVEPEPDVAVADGPKGSFAGHPTTAVLVVEVSDTTLSIDRGRKAGIYARAGIADYWIVNINRRQLEIYRRPVADATAQEGYRYDETTIRGEADSATPLAAPQAAIRVVDLLP